VLTGDVDRRIANAQKNIPGWGIDADADNDPTYPMKTRTGADFERIHYDKPVQQPVNIKVFQSIERPEMTRVFGTSTPASGLSGKIRAFAYKFSEADARHWLTLVMADRVNVVEGIIDDFNHGLIPNLIAERGWAAEFKYNRPAAVRKLAIGVAVSAAVVTFFVLKNKNKQVQPSS
jgi:hypothetical protein